MPKEESRQVRRAIRRVFVEVWDPIRVMADPEWPRDEYDAYIGRVFELLMTGGSDREIIEYLLLAGEGMGMDGSSASLETVVAALASRISDLVRRGRYEGLLQFARLCDRR